jgi:polyphosphate kinase 2
MDDATYERELLRLQTELVKLQEWVRVKKQRVVIVFEGRDAAGKGGMIARITQYLNPRWYHIVALPTPTEQERTQWYFQRYIAHLPAAGEMVLFDRSWYNRSGVERVMGFCTDAEYGRFLLQCPAFERMLIDDGIILLKYWLSISDDEQERRFKARIEDRKKRWKLSPVDVQARLRWVDYSKAKDAMFARCDTPDSPWWEIDTDSKKAARINCIHHLLSAVPYREVKQAKATLPKRPPAKDYVRPPRDQYHYVPDVAATL